VLEERVGYRERGGYNTSDVEFHQFDVAATQVREKIMVSIFTGDKSSPNYKPGTIEELASHIVMAVGASGTNLEYVLQTAEAIRMILPPGETDKHLFDLEAACKALDNQMRDIYSLPTDTVYEDEKYEKRREMLRKIFRAVDKDLNRELTLTEFQNLALNILNLNNTLSEVEEKFHKIDKDKNGKLSTREFVDYFLTDLAENEERFKEDYLNFGLDTDRNSFEHGLLLYEAMDGLKSQSNSVVSMEELLAENALILERMRVRTDPKAREVLEFFFPETIGKAIKLWFGRCEVNDAIIKRRFTDLTKLALVGELDHWLCSATETLALVIILTQMTRSIHRGTPEQFCGDSKALSVTLTAIFRGYHRALTPLQTIFLPGMALSCQEDIHCHELASEIWINYVAPKLPPDDPLRVIQNNFKNSLNIIRTFGRFPHRNDLLGRKTTDLEASFLDKIRSKEGQSIIFKSDGTVERDDSEEGMDNAITQLLFRMPKKSGAANGIILSDEKIASLHQK